MVENPPEKNLISSEEEFCLEKINTAKLLNRAIVRRGILEMTARRSGNWVEVERLSDILEEYSRSLKAFNKEMEEKYNEPEILDRCELFHIGMGSGFPSGKEIFFDFPEGEYFKFIQNHLGKLKEFFL